ncbi:MAG: phospho-sugar mutase [Planctomycetota bacterium]|nr:phospho-sugar mutase [Planctomycetota bacterium]
MSSGPVLSAVEAAGQTGKLSPGAVRNLSRWLTESGFANYVPQIASLVDAGRFEELESLFWEVLPFGTGGRRGLMADLGSATMNARTVAESASGIATYLKSVKGTTGGRAVIAHDTRLRSREFAELSARVFAAAGLKVFLFDSFRSTPELSFAVRHLKCDVGVMISASHNPPSDNGVKAYWSNGAQVLPPHDKGIIDCVYQTNEIPLVDLAAAVESGQIELIGDDVDDSFIRAVRILSLSSARSLSVIYTPLHGVGETSVYRVLEDAGFENVQIFEPQRAPDGNFPNVPKQLPNPELTAVFGPPIEAAKAASADLVLASDPDADRLGAAVRDGQGNYVTISGNRIGVLLVDYVLRKRKAVGTLGKGNFVVETMVTTPLITAIANTYKVRVYNDLLVGFKYIAQVVDREGAERFLLGCEESLGYLAGGYARDKDASIAALYLCECAAELKRQGKTLLDRLDELFIEYGYHTESQRSETAKGAQGRAMVEQLLKAFAEKPPVELAGVKLGRVRDYAKHQIRRLPENTWQADLPSPSGDLVFFESVPGDFEISFAVRPSGTEPKIKFYFFAKKKLASPELLPTAKAQADAKLHAVEEALSAWVKGVWGQG